MRHGLALTLLAAAVASPPAVADRLVGEDRFLCATVRAIACGVVDDCVEAHPSTWNVPDFVVIDLDAKLLSTTPSSDEHRTTPIRNVQRADGLIILQGSEAGRAFSFVLTEETGTASVAVARDGMTVGVFGSCTPLPDTR